jgi:LuxR family maltose regulon positive regulatory protein
MATPLLATKLYIPPPRPDVVRRPRLLTRLNAGLHRKLTLISAPAGFGKTTLVSEWVNQPAATGGMPDAATEPHHPAGVAWLSLDTGDSDPTRFLTYLVAALQTVAPTVGAGVAGVLQSPQPPPVEALLTTLLNEISTIPDNFLLVLDDYHMLDAPPIDTALTFLLDHLPPRMHLVIATREDPALPLARLRARGQLTELRASDLRFTPAEAAAFLNQMMGLNLAADDIAALEQRTEGWIAGLQLAALSMQAQQDITGFIRSFTGSHRFVLDYLVEEVLQQQPEPIQNFLLHTSVLDRLCGPLCDAVLPDSTATGQTTLEYIEHANLFIVPLDNERRWYRYHHLFAELLRQRLQQQQPDNLTVLHQRAGVWFEANGLELEAFQHAAAANDIERAMRLIEGGGMPLHFRGAVAPVLTWLESLPAAVLDAHPALWVMYASALSVAGRNTGIEEKLQAAEAALQGRPPDEHTRDLIGRIAAIRALLGAMQYQVETIIDQSRRALEYLHPDNLPVRTATTWKLGLAYQFQGERAAARQAYTEAITMCAASGNVFINLLATTGLGIIQESDTQLSLADETYRRVLELAGDPSRPAACEAYFGLARICYEWNDLDAAQQHGEQSVQLARQIEMVDSFVAGELFLARLKRARGDLAGAATLVAAAEESARRHNFVQQMPEVAAAQIMLLLLQGRLDAAAHLAQTHDLPLCQARVHLAQGDPAAALALLEPVQRQAETRAWPDERLKVLLLQALAHHAQGAADQARHLLSDALALAEPAGCIRTFVDEGPPMAQLLTEAAAYGIMPDYSHRLLTAYATGTQDAGRTTEPAPAAHGVVSDPVSLVEPLSQRELEILRLIAQGLSNREISARLVLALDTVKGHNRRIYDKLQVQRRTEAVARARELGLL